MGGVLMTIYDEPQGPPLTAKRAGQSKAVRVLRALSDVAPVLAMAGVRHPAFAYVGVTIKLAEVFQRAYAEYRTETGSPWDFFEHGRDDSPWEFIPPPFVKFLHKEVTDQRCVVKGSTPESACGWMGRFADKDIGWIADGEGKNVDVSLVRREDAEHVHYELKEIIWKSLPSPHVAVQFEGVVEDEFKPAAVVQTNLIEQVGSRVEAFHQNDIPRAYLLIGQPGTGKTTCIQHAMRTLKLRSVRVPFGTITAKHSRGPQGPRMVDAFDFEGIIKVIRPEVVILDDIDRVPEYEQGYLLDFLESTRRYAKIIIASANDVNALTAAVKRPGRFDDHIKVPNLPHSTIAQILGDHADLAPQMEDWPVAYIFEFMSRVKVLGSEQARKELFGLKMRLKHSRSEDDPSPVDSVERAS